MNSRAPRTRDDHDAVGGDDARAWRRASVSLSLSHDSSEGGASTRPRLDRSIVSFDGSIDRSVGRSFDRSIERVDGVGVRRAPHHICICTSIYTYITINIPYQYTHHRLNPHTHPPRSSIESFSRVFHSFHVASFVDSSRLGARLVVVVSRSNGGDRRRARRRRSRSSSSHPPVDRTNADGCDDDGRGRSRAREVSSDDSRRRDDDDARTDDDDETWTSDDRLGENDETRAIGQREVEGDAERTSARERAREGGEGRRRGTRRRKTRGRDAAIPRKRGRSGKGGKLERGDDAAKGEV